ncbi:MAG TPA: hypothetical protein VG015_06380 [Candidatus Dormibacteraeota bacterium]|nr:hypothetical protein [Candidatus Dormibacteraeota bacterium]
MGQTRPWTSPLDAFGRLRAKQSIGPQPPPNPAANGDGDQGDTVVPRVYAIYSEKPVTEADQVQ